MINPLDLDKAMSELTRIIAEINSVTNQHNTMLHDLYERISIIEKELEIGGMND